MRAASRVLGRYRRISRTVAVVALLYSIALVLTGGFEVVVAGVLLRSHEVDKFVTLAIIAGLLDVLGDERTVDGSWTLGLQVARTVAGLGRILAGVAGIGLLLGVLFWWVAGFVRPMTLETPFADMALLELYTRHAAQNDLLVGPYSRFFWHHPGPAMFYLFRPLYELSGERYESIRWSSREGVPLAAENDPRLVFERLFQDNSPNARAAMQKRLAEERSILDMVQENTRALHRRLGRNDQQKLDEYLTSVRAVEGQIRRSEAWLNVPRPKVDSGKLDLEVSPRAHDDLKQYLRTMFDLIFLAFQSDTTRVCTFQLDQEVANHPFTKFLGFTDTYHGLSHHGGDPDTLKKLAQVDRFYLDQLASFLRRLKAAKEPDGTMLDRTLILYGSGMNNGERGGHFSTNLPILFAGGRKLGVKQGQHLAFKQLDHKILQRHTPARRRFPISSTRCWNTSRSR